MKYLFLFMFLSFSISFEAKSLPFEDGYTYTVLDSNILLNHFDVSCINDDECFFLSRKKLTGAIIYKTSDGGKTRKLVYIDTATMKDGSIDYNPDYLGQRIFFFKSGVVIVAGYFGVFLKSTDFGETWKKYKSENYFDFFDVKLVDEKLAFLANDKSVAADGKIHYSTDGCETWKLFPVPDSISTKWWSFSLSIQTNGDLLIGFFSKPDIENWVMYKTNFDGSKWELMNTPTNTYEISYMSDREWVARCVILNEEKVYQYVTAYKTYDAGKTWDLKFKSESPFISAKLLLFSKSLNTGYILGPKNLILKTKDKGDSWYFIRDSLSILGQTTSISGASVPSDNVLYYTTTLIGRLVKYSNDAANVTEPTATTSSIYPNPIHNNNSFTVDFELSKSGILRQYICNLGGREISELYLGFKETGKYISTYKLPDNLVNGSYWFVTEMDGICQIQMLNVVK